MKITSVLSAVGFVSSVLSAQAASAYLTASPSSVYFFDQEVGRSGASQSVTIRNNDREPINGLNIFDNCFGDFNVANYGCFGTLPAYGSCTINVRFEPRSVGSHSCTIQISGGGQYETVRVSGRGVDRRYMEGSDLSAGSQLDEEVPADFDAEVAPAIEPIP